MNALGRRCRHVELAAAATERSQDLREKLSCRVGDLSLADSSTATPTSCECWDCPPGARGLVQRPHPRIQPRHKTNPSIPARLAIVIQRLYNASPCGRHTLDTYPFAQRRCLVESGPMSPITRMTIADAILASSCESPRGGFHAADDGLTFASTASLGLVSRARADHHWGSAPPPSRRRSRVAGLGPRLAVGTPPPARHALPQAGRKCRRSSPRAPRGWRSSGQPPALHRRGRGFLIAKIHESIAPLSLVVACPQRRPTTTPPTTAHTLRPTPGRPPHRTATTAPHTTSITARHHGRWPSVSHRQCRHRGDHLA